MKYIDLRKLNIENAIKAGIKRSRPVEASNNQILSYMLIEFKPFHHATLESASAERYFLQAALGKRIRMIKVWNTGRQAIQDDMCMLRAMLDETENWDPAFEALDRVLTGAGYQRNKIFKSS